MSVRAMSWAYGQRVGNPGRKLVLLTLADHADEVGFSYPALSTIAELSEMSERSAQVHLRKLEEAGLLETKERYRPNGSQTSNGYQLHLQTPHSEGGGANSAPPPEVPGGGGENSAPSPRKSCTPGVKPASPPEPLSEHTTSAREASSIRGESERQLRDYLAEWPQALEILDDMAPSSARLLMGVWGAYGPQGTRAELWGRVPLEQRPRLLAGAIVAAGTEEASYRGYFFESILRRLIGEYWRPSPEEEGKARRDRGRSQASRFTAESESAREAERRARVRAEEEQVKRVQAEEALKVDESRKAVAREWLDQLEDEDRRKVEEERDRRLLELGWAEGAAPPLVVDGILLELALERMDTDTGRSKSDGEA